MKISIVALIRRYRWFVSAGLVALAAIMLLICLPAQSYTPTLSTKGLVYKSDCDPRFQTTFPGNLVSTELDVTSSHPHWMTSQFMDNGDVNGVQASWVMARFDKPTHFLRIQWRTILKQMTWLKVVVVYTDQTTSNLWVLPNQTSQTIYLQKDQHPSWVVVYGNSTQLPPATCQSDRK